MRNIFKFFGIMVFSIVIVFATTGCSGPDDFTDTTHNSPNGGNSGGQGDGGTSGGQGGNGGGNGGNGGNGGGQGGGIQDEPGIPVFGASLVESLQWLQANAESNTKYTIEITDNEAISSSQLLSYRNRGKSNVIVQIIGSVGEEKIISLIGSGPLFTVTDDVTLILDNNVTLQRNVGDYSNDWELIRVVEGTLIMNAGSKISSRGYSGTCVLVEEGAFAMTGGEISDHSYGVYFQRNSTFTMTGGKISGRVSLNSNSTFTMTGGKISGGVSLNSNSTFTMTGGEISDVFFGDSTFTMTGGEIAAVFFGDSTFTMSGGEISHGVSLNSNSTFTMTGGEISNNLGIGVSFRDNSTFTMSDGKISGNNMRGGVYIGGNTSTFTMEGGEISGNTSTSMWNGGGVSSFGTFTMTGGEISGNTSTRNGGGVFAGGTTFTMTGGKISNNTSMGDGGGVCL
jgi:hypothetical protein